MVRDLLQEKFLKKETWLVVTKQSQHMVHKLRGSVGHRVEGGTGGFSIRLTTLPAVELERAATVSAVRCNISSCELRLGLTKPSVSILLPKLW